MGEEDVVKALGSAMQEMEQSAHELCLSTLDGRFHVRRDENGSATALGQLSFFAEFLEATGLFARWVDGCPLTYTSPNAPVVVDLLGPWLLPFLMGSDVMHIAGLRGDEIAPEILGMGKIVSDESLRRALSALAPFTQTL